MSGRKQWNKQAATSSFLDKKTPQSLIQQGLEGSTVVGIDGMTDVGDLLHGSGRLHLLFIGIIGCYLPSRIGSGFHGLQRLGSCSGQRFHIWAAVRHLTKLHIGTSFRYFI